IGCLLVRPDMRGQGVARALVEAAPRIAREWGAQAIEAYPRRSNEPLHPEEAWQGPERVFVEAGFEPVVDVTPYPVYRKGL
ncbi:MAG: Acetyltransferase, partial [Labilithrix sp.]|nr:Acetyltransferase [Labilithrix sp.]